MKKGRKHPYDTTVKQKWRERIYGILGTCAPGPLLMLPGPKKHEICTALEHGFPLENLILIGDKAADFANMTRNFLSDYPPDKRPELPPHPTGFLSDRCRELAAQGVKIKDWLNHMKKGRKHPYDTTVKQKWRERIYGILGTCAPGPS